MNIISFKYLEKTKTIFKPDMNNREINIYKVESSKTTGHNLYYPNVLLKSEQLILPILEKTMSLKSGTIYEKNDMKFNYVKSSINNTICETPLFFFIYNTDNYFHFLYDALPYLISFQYLKKDIPSLKLLMQYPNPQKNEFYPFVTEFLELLNITNEDIVLINESTLYKTIYISTSYTHDFDSNLPPRQEIYQFYQNIVKIVKKKHGDIITPPKIYISRRTWLHNDFTNIGTNYTTRRKLINEDEIVEKLTMDGYQEVFTEKLSTVEKIMYFANATHVVGAIGGGISNVLFSSPCTKLIVLVSPTFLDVNVRFKYSLDCVDVTYNMSSSHVENGPFKTYMRVKTKDNKLIGEIEKIYDNKLIVSYTDGSNTGWNSQNVFNTIELLMVDVDKLDEGLNSAWTIN